MALLFPKVPFSDAKTELHETGPCPESKGEKSVSCSIALWVHLAASRSKKKAVECPLVLFPQTLNAPLAQKDPRATYAPRVCLSVNPSCTIFISLFANSIFQTTSLNCLQSSNYPKCEPIRLKALPDSLTCGLLLQIKHEIACARLLILLERGLV